MKKLWHLRTLMVFASISVASLALAAKKNLGLEEVKAKSEAEVKAIVEPLLAKYCSEQCKILKLSSEAQLVTAEQTSPGFEEDWVDSTAQIAPESVTVNILVDEMVGPITREKLFTLLQKHFEKHSFRVVFDASYAHFPQPPGFANKVQELRGRHEKEIRDSFQQLISKFCAERCLLGTLDVEVTPINIEELQYGSSQDFLQEGNVAVKVSRATATLLLDESLSPEERSGFTEMVRLRTSHFKTLNIDSQVMKFPKTTAGDGYDIDPLTGKPRKLSKELTSKDETNQSSKDSKETNQNSLQNTMSDTKQASEQNSRQERFEKFEKIERVENGDAVQAELKQFQKYALLFGILVLVTMTLGFALMAIKNKDRSNPLTSLLSKTQLDQKEGSVPISDKRGTPNEKIALRYEIDNLIEELTKVFAENPKVAKVVFSRVLTEEGVEITANYIAVFGESVVMELLKDPSLQREVSGLAEFYAKNSFEISDEEKLELLRSLYNRTIAAKMVVFGNRSSTLFEFLAEMDGPQIHEMIRNESLTVKAIVLTQIDEQKRFFIYSNLDGATKTKLLSELSRIDYLPRDYIFNVAIALKKKRTENPKLNTESLPGSEVLVGLLERTETITLHNILKNLEQTNPDSVRIVKSKLISIDSLVYLRDNQLMDVILSLKHDELLMFLKGTPKHIQDTIFSKSPPDLVADLKEEIGAMNFFNPDTYQNIERKIVNRIRIMANEGLVNISETNERMFSDGSRRVQQPLQSVKENPTYSGQFQRGSRW